VQDVYKHTNKQKCGKSAGVDGISMEAIIYGNVRLVVHNAHCLTCFWNMVICLGHSCSMLL